MWCSTQCRRRAHDARRVAVEGSRPVEVVTVPTVRTKYVKVPLRELHDAIRDSPEMAVKFAEAVKWMTSRDFQYPQVKELIQQTLHEAGVASLAAEMNALNHREGWLKRGEEGLAERRRQLEASEALLREREAELGRRERALARREAAPAAPVSGSLMNGAYWGEGGGPPK